MEDIQQKAYTAQQIKEDAKERFHDEDTSVISYTYPIGEIGHGPDGSTTVTVDVTVEAKTKYDPFEEKHVTTGAHARFEDLTTEPFQAFINGAHEDTGPVWMEQAVSIAREWYSVEELLMEAGVDYDVLGFGSEIFYYFDEDKARDKIERTVYDAWMQTVGQDLDEKHEPLPESVEEIYRRYK